MTGSLSPREFLIDLPDFWQTRRWDEAGAQMVRSVLGSSMPGVTLRSLPALSASGAVPVEAPDGSVEQIVFTFFGLWFAEDIGDIVDVDGRRSRNHIELDPDTGFDVEEFSFVGEGSPDGRVPVMLFSTPNLALAEALGEAFRRIAGTARWSEAA